MPQLRPHGQPNRTSKDDSDAIAVAKFLRDINVDLRHSVGGTRRTGTGNEDGTSLMNQI